MNIPQYIMAKGDFIATVSDMGNKVIVIVPKQYHNQFDKVKGKFLKFHWEEILEK